MLETETGLTLQTLLSLYPNTAVLRSGQVQSPLVHFAFADVAVANKAFKSLVREQAFDVGELAIVTYLQAKAFGKPYVLMPAVVVARGQHHTILYNPSRRQLSPGDLAGCRVGVRSYTQTTGAWVRGILEEDYGVDFKRVQWITFEDPHVAEYSDPPWVKRASAGQELLQMLLDGELDAAIFGSEMPAGNLKPLIPDAEVAARRWAGQHGGVPINHMMVVKESLTQSRPDVVREVYRLLQESQNAARTADNAAAYRFGVESVRKSLETIIYYSFRQGLIPRRFAVDELFNEVTGVLG